MLHKIRHQKLNVNVDGCRNLMMSTSDRDTVKMLVKNKQHYVNYKLFGTVTGRLTTDKDSFPILNMKSKFRSLIKPTNDWFVSFDYNGAEIRTFLALSGHEQPREDIHKWNMKNIYLNKVSDRDEAKVRFFSSFYNHSDTTLDGTIYSRKSVVDHHYDGKQVRTQFGREISVDDRKAFNYIIQSTTNDIVLDRAAFIERELEGTKSHIAFIVHDEILIDMHHDDRHRIPKIKQIFEQNRLGNFVANIKAGKDYGNLKELQI